MKVRILVEALFADFSKMPKMGAKVLKVGDEIDYPDYYALDVIEAGLAERVVAYTPDATLGAQKLAEKHDIDLANVEGTGEKGRVIKADVQAIVEKVAEKEQENLPDGGEKLSPLH